MLFKERFWAGLKDGSVTVAYRRWKRPSVRSGGTLNSPGGLLGIDSVDLIDESSIDDAGAAAAGYRDVTELMASLRPEGALYRVRFHRIGDDPRVALRDTTALRPEEAAQISGFLDRNDWARAYLHLIAEFPGTVSTDLAAKAGIDRPVFKQRVRRLKELGLTESLEVGYRLSPRGAAALDRDQTRDTDPGR